MIPPVKRLEQRGRAKRETGRWVSNGRNGGKKKNEEETGGWREGGGRNIKQWREREKVSRLCAISWSVVRVYCVTGNQEERM